MRNLLFIIIAFCCASVSHAQKLVTANEVGYFSNDWVPFFKDNKF